MSLQRMTIRPPLQHILGIFIVEIRYSEMVQQKLDISSMTTKQTYVEQQIN